MLTEETLFPMRQEELETEARNLRASIGGLSRWFQQVASQHVVGLAFALWIAPPSKLHCSNAWTAVALVLMAAGFYLVGFVMLMLRLMQRYAELEATEGQLR
ncbi:hypothetical protein ACJRO7_004569 [Eucalyptus globulus]|uniref:Uncharacterized protein n=1 Tax=Eucalyptus globulus TaxID=34317 RepID=A0ABD3J0E7_EUCGL